MWRQVPSTSSYADNDDDRILVTRNDSTSLRPARNHNNGSYKDNNGSSSGSSSSINGGRLKTPVGYTNDNGSNRFSAGPDASSSSGDANGGGYRPLRDYGTGNSATVDTIVDLKKGTTVLLLGGYGSRPYDNRKRRDENGRLACVTYCAWLVALLLILLLMALFYAMALQPIFEQRRLRLQNRHMVTVGSSRRPANADPRYYGGRADFERIFESTALAETVAPTTTTIAPKTTEGRGGVADTTRLSSLVTTTITTGSPDDEDFEKKSYRSESRLHSFEIFSFSDEMNNTEEGNYGGRASASIVVAEARGEEFLQSTSVATETTTTTTSTPALTTTVEGSLTTMLSENQTSTKGSAVAGETETSVSGFTKVEEPLSSTLTTIQVTTTTVPFSTTRANQRYSHHLHRHRKPVPSTPKVESSEVFLKTTKYYIVKTRPTKATATTTTSRPFLTTTKLSSIIFADKIPTNKSALTVFNPIEAIPPGTYGDTYGTLDANEYDERENYRSTGNRGAVNDDRRLPNHAFDDSGDEGIRPVEISMESEGSNEVGNALGGGTQEADDWATFEWPPSFTINTRPADDRIGGGGKLVVPVWRRLPPGNAGDDPPPVPTSPRLPFAVSASVITVPKVELAPLRSAKEATTLGPAISSLKRRRAAAPTVVTALLDIGRGEWPHFTRPFDIYLAYFEKLLRLENNMIVYGEPRVIQFVDARLGALGAAARRRVQTVEITLADLPLFRYRDEIQQILDAEQADWVDGWDRQMRSHPEARYADYDVLVNSKPYLLQNATRISKFQAQFFVWVDAGYGHGSDDVIPAGVVWCPRLTPERITLFRLTPEVERIERYRLEHVYRRKKSVVSGGFLAGDVPTLQRFNAFFTKTFMEMLDDGKVDDDQTTLLMTIRHYRSLFHILDGGWFNAFKALPGQCA